MEELSEERFAIPLWYGHSGRCRSDKIPADRKFGFGSLAHGRTEKRSHRVGAGLSIFGHKVVQDYWRLEVLLLQKDISLLTVVRSWLKKKGVCTFP